MRVSTSDRTVLVTGCDQGFGQLTAKRLHALGCTVFATCLLEKSVEQYKQELNDERFVPVLLDVTDEDSVAKAFAQVSAALRNFFFGFGVGRINGTGSIGCFDQ